MLETMGQIARMLSVYEGKGHHIGTAEKQQQNKQQCKVSEGQTGVSPW